MVKAEEARKVIAIEKDYVKIIQDIYVRNMHFASQDEIDWDESRPSSEAPL